MEPVRAVAPCPHCGTPVEGPAGAFCCHGCEQAAAILREAGLEGWYAAREQPAPRAGPAAEVAWSTVPVVAEGEGACRADLAIDGLRCASCVWVTERLLERTEGVRRATVSYATGRAQVVFDPTRLSLADVAARVAAIGYRPRPLGGTDTLDRDLLVRLGVAAFGAMNVMGLSVALYAGWLDGMDERFAALFRWMALLVATPVVTWSAVPFFRGAWQGLRAGLPSMDLPVALAVALLYVHGLVATSVGEEGYLDSVTMLVALLLAGRVLEARGRKRAVDAALSLAASVPRLARRAVGDSVEVVPSAALAVGDRIDLGSGDEVAADGVVLEGRALVRMAVLTGESRPVEVSAGDRVVAGALVEDGAVRVGVVRAGEHTLVARMAADLGAATAAPREPRPTDRLAPAFTVGTLAVAAATALATGSMLGADTALARTVAVLVVACPCALALAEPLVGAAGLGALARRGLLVRSIDGLTALGRVDTVVLDKTGTVTWGRPKVVAASDEAIRVAAGLERFSRHPVASAIVEAAVERGIAIPVATDVREVAGQGIEGSLDGRRWRIRRGGPERVLVEDACGTVHAIALVDVPRPAVADDVARLRRAGLRVVLLSGDDPTVAARVGRDVGVDEVMGGVDPRGKADAVRALQRAGRHVLFVGDGLNDGPALVAADVGVAMADGAASSLLAADAVLAGDRIGPILAGLAAGPVVVARIGVGLRRSLAYNVTAVGAAVAGLVNPLVAAVLMPLSSGLVIANAVGTERAVARAAEV
jgi:Cu2+-exporting ATPase